MTAAPVGGSLRGRLRTLGRQLAAGLELFPCPLCEHGDGAGENRLCPDCRKRLTLLTGPRCPGCGGELDGVLGVCSRCLQAPPTPWRAAVSAFAYRGDGAELIRRFKYGGRPELARTLAQLMLEVWREQQLEVDLMVPVPLHWTRRLRRGFNQSELLARSLAPELGVPVRSVLRRTRRVPHQAGLNRERRLKNLRGAFQLRDPAAIAGKRVLLIDDVITTGATLNAAAEALCRGDPAELYVLTAARA